MRRGSLTAAWLLCAAFTACSSAVDYTLGGPASEDDAGAPGTVHPTSVDPIRSDAAPVAPDAPAAPPEASAPTPDHAPEPPQVRLPLSGDGGHDAQPASCKPGTGLPYVVTTDARLFRFDPTDLRFSIAGWLSCAIVPSSMAIDKTGQAWVHSKDDRFFKVDPATLHCKEVYLHRSGADASRYGLGFAEDPAGGPETLYAAGKNGLGTIDVRSLVLTPKESWSKGLVGPAELAGQGTTLYALFVTGSSHVLGIVDPLNGTLTKTLPITLGTFRAYAMAAWHESLWLFTNGDVHRYDLETGTTTLVVENAGFEVVGAGSTACVLAP